MKRMNWWLGCLTVCGLALGVAATAWADEWFVDATVAASGDGTSLETAFKTLEEGLSAAAEGDAVWLAPGTYDGDVEAMETFKGELRGLSTAAETIVEGSPDCGSIAFTGLSDLTLLDGHAGLGDARSAWTDGQTDAVFERCIIRGWTVTREDQPLLFCKELRNCLVAGNECDCTFTALIQAELVANCTLVGNRADNGVFDGYTDYPADEWITCVAVNTILWDNYMPVDSGDVLISYLTDETGYWDDDDEWVSTGYTVENCCANPNSVETWDDDDELIYEQPDEWEGLTVIFADPCFVDAANGDYRLAEGSPCIDAGAPEWVLDGEQDVEGDDRVQGEAPDIGCFENEEAASQVTSQIVHFDPNGGTCKKTSMTAVVGETYAKLATATRAGFKFLGWFDAKKGGKRIRIGTEVSAVPELTLYAHWEQTVRFDANGGTCKKASMNAVVGETYAKLATAAWEGYKFLGWYDAPEGGNRVRIGTEVPAIPERTLYAHWEQTVRFDANGGTCKKASMTAVVGETYTKLASATLEGCKFLGWYDAREGGNRVRIGMKAPAIPVLTLYAHWKAN